MRRWLLVLALAGCTGDFDPQSFVTGLRVLAVKAEPPELAPGQTATLTPLVVDFNNFDGGVRPYTVDWALCNEAPLPGDSVGADCVAADAGDSLTHLGSGLTMQVTMPQVTADQLGVPDSTGGVYLPVVLNVSAPRLDGSGKTDFVNVVYRLRYTQMISTPVYSGPLQPVNHNPTIDQIQIVYEDDLGVKPLVSGAFELNYLDRVTLRATFAPGSAEMYPTIEGTLPTISDAGISLDGGIQFFDGGINIGGIQLLTVTELLRVSWLTSIGSLSPDVTGVAMPNTTLKLDKKHTPITSADVDLYIVARDERGGVDWTTRTIHIP